MIGTWQQTRCVVKTDIIAQDLPRRGRFSCQAMPLNAAIA
jgi:hypothetical protein